MLACLTSSIHHHRFSHIHKNGATYVFRHLVPPIHAFNTKFVCFLRSIKYLQIQVSGVKDVVHTG